MQHSLPTPQLYSQVFKRREMTTHRHQGPSQLYAATSNGTCIYIKGDSILFHFLRPQYAPFSHPCFKCEECAALCDLSPLKRFLIPSCITNMARFSLKAEILNYLFLCLPVPDLCLSLLSVGKKIFINEAVFQGYNYNQHTM